VRHQVVAAGGSITPVQQAEIADMDAHDVVFADIDLEWWMQP
jgi:hypothetical protein